MKPIFILLVALLLTLSVSARAQTEAVALEVTSGTTTATTSIEALPANTGRKFLIFQNQSDTDMYINFGEAATATSLRVIAGGNLLLDEIVTYQTVNVYCASSAKAFTCVEN